MALTVTTIDGVATVAATVGSLAIIEQTEDRVVIEALPWGTPVGPTPCHGHDHGHAKKDHKKPKKGKGRD